MYKSGVTQNIVGFHGILLIVLASCRLASCREPGSFSLRPRGRRGGCGRGGGIFMFIAHVIDTKLVDSFLYLQFDFIRSLECAILMSVTVKLFTERMEYLSIKRTLEK